MMGKGLVQVSLSLFQMEINLKIHYKQPKLFNKNKVREFKCEFLRLGWIFLRKWWKKAGIHNNQRALK